MAEFIPVNVFSQRIVKIGERDESHRDQKTQKSLSSG